MKETLKRELNKTYLILSSEDAQYEESYEIEMIIKNAPQTILPLHVSRVDGEMQLFYDVSSKQNLKACAGRTKLSAATIRSLFETIEQLIKEMRDYLLDMECIVLDLEHIYAKEGTFYFCYCPWEKREVLGGFRGMLEEILGNLDYHDTEGVELAYHLYQNACKGDFHIAEILSEHCKKEEKCLDKTEQYETCFSNEGMQQEKFSEDDKKEDGEGNKKKRTGIIWRILQFFMKKEEERPEVQNDTFDSTETYEEFFYRDEPETKYGEVQVITEGNTMLLENAPMGRWRLRPLVPGYEEFDIVGESFLVGKKRELVDGYIGRDTISRIHSRLFVKNERFFIADANSTNGTFVNGAAIEPGKDVEIFAGDRILFADVEYECYNSL